MVKKYTRSKPLLMTGDLSNLPPRVERAVEEIYGHHRDPWFSETLFHIERFFKREFYNTSLQPLLLTATRTGAIEALISNTCTKRDSVWVIGNNRAATVALPFTVPIHFPEEPKAKELQQLPSPTLVIIDCVLEDGTLLSIKKISNSVRRLHPNTIIACDVSTSFGIDHIPLKDTLLDAIVCSPERGLMSIPGTTVISINAKFLRRARILQRRTIEHPYLFDLIRAKKAWIDKQTTPFSPNISSAVALKSAIEIIEENGGLTQVIKRQEIFAKNVRVCMNGLGFNLKNSDTKKLTNGFSVFTASSSRTVQLFRKRMRYRHIILPPAIHSKNVTVGHCGYISTDDLAAFASACGVKSSLHPLPALSSEGRAMRTGSNDVFSIPVAEFKEHSLKNLYNFKSVSDALVENVRTSIEVIFSDHDEGSLNLARNRTIGFIGAGNIVKATVTRCQSLGIKNIIVYAPSLAALQVNDPKNPRLQYWEKQNVHVARSPKEIYLTAHTVVLLPLVYTKKALRLFKKSNIYMNEGVINKQLLDEIREKGCMDIMINASARSALIKYPDLARTLREGWFNYYSDELSPNTNSVAHLSNVFFTAHVGGSCTLPQRAVLQNTRRILKAVIRQIQNNKDLDQKVEGYAINRINEFLKPMSVSWKATRINTPHNEIRILVVDPFDIRALQFSSLETKETVLRIKDISQKVVSESMLIREIKSFKPNILMLRSRTTLTRRLFEEIRGVDIFSTVIRPGVGVDNMYDGIEEASKQGIQIINEPTGNSFAVAEMTMHFILSSPPRILLTPGPTNVYKPVFAVLQNSYPHPGTPAYWKAFETLLYEFQRFVFTKRETLILNGPSTGFMEGAIMNLTSEGDYGLIIAHGKFGQRFIQICEKKNRKCIALTVSDREWGKGFSSTHIQKKIRIFEKAHPHKKLTFLCFQQNETSTGVAYHADTIRKIVAVVRSHNKNIQIIMDAVSGTGAYHLEFKKLGIDAAVVGSQKIVGISSGIAFLSLSTHAIKKMLRLSGYSKGLVSFYSDLHRDEYLERFERKQHVRYLSLLRNMISTHFHTYEEVGQIFHMLSARMSLKTLNERGGTKRLELMYKSMAEDTREVVRELGLHIMTARQFQSHAVTPVRLTGGIAASDVRKELKEVYGFAIAGSQSDLWKSTMIRIGHLGYILPSDLTRFFRAFKKTIRFLKANKR